jgi:hypothetical protein
MTAIGDWLRKLGACSEALPEFENFSRIGPGVESIKRPDWLLWFSFSQSTDEADKLRMIGALHKLMSGPVISALASHPEIQKAAVQALGDTAAFVEGKPVPEAHAHHDALLQLKLPLHQKTAADLARVLLGMCLTEPGVSSGAVGSILATKWTRFLNVEGDAATLSLTQKLREVIAFQNKSEFPT